MPPRHARGLMPRRAILLMLAALGLVAVGASAQPTMGLLVNDARAFPGYTLISPLRSSVTYLVDNDARPVHRWQTSNTPGLMGYLLDDGHLLRAAALAPAVDPHWTNAIGGGGRIEEYDWDGNLVWSYTYMDATHFQHHDIRRLPNGNVIFIAWQWKSFDEAVAAGRDPARTGAGIGSWPDSVIEVQPTGPTTGDIVWRWEAFDHLVQELDPSKANYDVVANHPELIDYNASGDDGQLDIHHCNGLGYIADLDQIIISSRSFNEFWIIDHSTTMAEAASHSGGRSGMGGDLLYRWGNPTQYGRGTAADRKLFNQHDAQWIPAGVAGEVHVTLFNNGVGRPDGNYSSADEVILPVNASGTYDLAPGGIYEPIDPVWRHTATPRNSLLSAIIGGAQRLPNGNTLISEGVKGTLIEVTDTGDVVWRYINPLGPAGPYTQGQAIPPGFANENAVFKARRYPLDHPAFTGRDLTPEEPIEIFAEPPPVPDGSGGTSPVLVSRLDGAGAQLRVTWDSTSCPAADYNLFFGDLAGVSTMRLDGGDCALGTSGSRDWLTVPPGNVYFLMVGVGEFPMYESRWGTDSFGRERNATHPSRTCGVTTKSTLLTCR